MPATDPLIEFRTAWLPNVSDSGLSRLVGLLESGNPLLIRGAFTRAVPMGCLASHIAWNHPATRDLGDEEAGVLWLTRVARLNPATSAVILAWDREGPLDRDLLAGLLIACRDEQARRSAAPAAVSHPECVVAE
ncbi:MAG TPA: hypothetical protein VFG68_03040 [Fimbriiglobus sp.]|nr:hypothetical protein [Fimbriiglobus sp.]